MARVIDELITEFKLKDSYSDKADKIKKKTGEVGDAQKKASGFQKLFADGLDSLTGMAGKAGSGIMKLGGAIGGIGGPIGIALAAVVGFAAVIGTGLVIAFTAVIKIAGQAAQAMIEFGQSVVMPAIEAYGKLDLLQRRLQGIYKDADKANRALNFAREFSKSGMADKASYENAVTDLAAAGLGPDWLKIVELVSAGQGGGKEHVERVTDLLRRIQAGGMGEAFGPEGLPMYLPGIQERNPDLFNGGAFKGNKKQALDLIQKEALAMTATLELTANSVNTAMTNLQTAFQVLQEGMGKAFAEAFLPIIKEVSAFMFYLSDSGVIEKVVNGFTDLFNFGEGGAQTGIITILAYVVATLERLPIIIKQVMTIAKLFWTAITNQVDQLISGLTDAINIYIKAFGFLMPGAMAIEIPKFSLKDTFKGLEAMWNLTNGDAISERAKELIEGFNASKKEQAKSQDISDLSFEIKNGNDKQQETLDEIATGQQKQIELQEKQLDLSRYALGGGELGRRGISEYERAGLATELRVRIDAGAWSAPIQQLMDQFFPTMVKAYGAGRR